jgi:hypothetical protein
VANSLARRITTSGAKTVIGSLAENNHYMVHFSSLKSTVYNYLKRFVGSDDLNYFLGEKAGILCSDASLPGSSYATTEVKNNFMGVPQQFSHTRLYTDIDFSFYIDKDYKLLRMFEGWMEYISSGANDFVEQESKGYYRRMRYPDLYKVDTMTISKFERDYGQTIKYKFINAFPKSLSNIPVTYSAAELLKVTVTFNYDRYVVF